LTDVDRAYVICGSPLPEEFTSGFGPPQLVGTVPVEFREVTDTTFNVWLYSKTDVNATPVNNHEEPAPVQ